MSTILSFDVESITIFLLVVDSSIRSFLVFLSFFSIYFLNQLTVPKLLTETATAKVLVAVVLFHDF